MTKWMCTNCKYLLQSDKPPDTCPSCKDKCAFSNVTCYIPDCGGEQNIDPQLVNRELQEKPKDKKN